VALVALLSACNGSFVGSGTLPASLGHGVAAFNFRIVCDPSTNQVSGTLDYSDPGAVGGPVAFSGRATGRAVLGVPGYYTVTPDCDTDPTSGQYTGTFGSGATAGTFNVQISTSASVLCLTVRITSGAWNGYLNFGCPTPGSIKSLQFISFPAGQTPFPGGASFVPATATQNLPLTFTSGTPAVCSVVAGQVLPLSAGGCRITASYTGGGLFTADPVTQTIRVAKAASSLSVSPLIAKSAVAALTSSQRTAPVTATLSGPGSTAANQAVVFTLNGLPLCTATTDWSGVATCTVGLLTPTGVQLLAPRTLVTATFAGSDSLLGSSGRTLVS
jgi:hypothetical protein